MSTYPLVRVGASLALVAAVSGCPSNPYTGAVAQYGTTTVTSTTALAAVPASAAELCRRQAHLTYLRKHLEGESVVAWTEFYTKGLATPKLAWKDFCAEIDATGPLFGAGVTTLSTYGTALGNLAGASAYAGTDIGTVATDAQAIASKLGASSAVSGSIAPVGAVLQHFATLFVQNYTEKEVKRYVLAADPIVGKLVDSLVAYVTAVETSLENIDVALAREVENSAEQSLVGAPSTAGKPDTAKLLELYQLAVAIDRQSDKTHAALEGYKSVLTQLRAAHAQLAKAGASDADVDVKGALSAIAAILGQLHALQGALAS